MYVHTDMSGCAEIEQRKKTAKKNVPDKGSRDIDGHEQVQRERRKKKEKRKK
jgi:hypothetical protein